MDPDPTAVAWTHTLVGVPPDTGELLASEWEATRRRVEIVHRTSVSQETEPAGAPRLYGDRG